MQYELVSPREDVQVGGMVGHDPGQPLPARHRHAL